MKFVNYVALNYSLGSKTSLLHFCLNKVKKIYVKYI